MSNVLFFSRQGVHDESKAKGPIIGVYLPSKDLMRRYSDIPNPSTSTVSERYGTPSQHALWGFDRNQVVVYGIMNKDLEERRQALSVYLPQDFSDKEATTFYFIFGDRWLVHGVRKISDDGRSEWDVSRLDTKDRGMVRELTETVSESVLETGVEHIQVAARTSTGQFAALQAALKPLGVNVQRFESLSPHKGTKPIYSHMDYSLFMLTGLLFAVLVLATVGVLWGLDYMKLDRVNKENEVIRSEISSLQADARMGHIKNPREILDVMTPPLKTMPSAWINAVGDTTNFFGTVKSINVDSEKLEKLTLPDGTTQNLMTVEVTVEQSEETLLRDQEQIAQAVLRDHPWVRKIERFGGSGKFMQLKLWLAVE